MPRDRDLTREPCPDRIVEDLGGAFGMGCVGGFLWHFVKGMRNSPKNEKFSGGLFSARMRAPILGGNFAVWGGTFSVFDCSFQSLRGGQEDHWNAIASGFCTGGVLAFRGGWRSSMRNAVIGGVLLGIIEMVSMALTRRTTVTPRQQFEQMQEFERQAAQRGQQQQMIKNAETTGDSGPGPGGSGGNKSELLSPLSGNSRGSGGFDWLGAGGSSGTFASDLGGLSSGGGSGLTSEFAD